mmetsp:Transcript_102729/g.203988  ORF Transcript_102729/g.203988 Transcript_102729/m.203988 type:complete len:240 (-) Transcript_102729:157-876(-)
MARLISISVSLLAVGSLRVAALVAKPVHPAGKYYVEEEMQPTDSTKNMSTKWATEEEHQKMMAKKRAAKAHVAMELGKPKAMDAGAEVALSDDGFGLTVEKAGDGLTFPKSGDVLTMHYTGKLKDGTVFDSSRQRNRTFTFTIGKGEVIRGWDQGIITMSLGERALLHIPSYKGYGSRGAGPIPPNAALEFDVELLAINDVAAPGFTLPTKAPRLHSAAGRASTTLVCAIVTVAALIFQ